MNKKIYILLLAISLPLFILDATVLKGETVQDLLVSHNEIKTISIKAANVPYSLRVDTSFKAALNTLLTDPNGHKLIAQLEPKEHSGVRHYHFYADSIGEYKLKIQFINLIGTETALVSVIKNDRRILPKLSRFIKLLF